MHASFTFLGSTNGNPAATATDIADYLEGRNTSALEKPGSQAVAVGPSASVGGYYADSAAAMGRWHGSGVEQYSLATNVEPVELERLLLGQHPIHGNQLVSAAGSSGRALNDQRTALPAGEGPVSLTEAAAAIGVHPGYLRRLAKANEVAPHERTGAWLEASRDQRGRWIVERDEVERFRTARNQPRVIMGYDVTFSVPKSVSLLWAVSDRSVRSEIDAAIEAATHAGLDYLEAEAFDVRDVRGRTSGDAMVAAIYRHHTSRALEPQLHEHAVIANVARHPDGRYRAVDARGLLAHKMTAGYLAGAELRSQLTKRLDVAWTEPHKGQADIVGVPRDAIEAMSSRRHDVLAEVEQFGTDTVAARQMAALVTRPGKDTSVDSTALQQQWRSELTEYGLSPETAAELAVPDQSQELDLSKLFSHLGSRHGVTEQHAVFDRRDVIAAVANEANHRLSASETASVADEWLASRDVVELGPIPNTAHESIGKPAGSVALAAHLPQYTTVDMLCLENRVIAAHAKGLDAGVAVAAPQTIDAAIAAQCARTQLTLGSDQEAMVRSICGSGHQFQAVVGRAGSGKTTALRTAVEAWQTSGTNVIGLAPTAAAARKLASETAIPAHTVAHLLTKADNDGPEVLRPGTVVIVDEASMIPNRDLDRLYQLCTQTGSALRTVGDPQQHSAVEAGGLWPHLTRLHPTTTPTLHINRRQIGDDMTEVRSALDDYRSGNVAKSVERLEADERLTTTDSWDELLDTMADDWFAEHTQPIAHAGAPSQMIAERNVDRHALNTRAQTLLRDAGQLGPTTVIAGIDFHVGDYIVTQARHPTITTPTGLPLNNSSFGTITEIDESGVTVDFVEHGVMTIDRDFIATEVGPGRGGGIAPAYAITSHKAQGQTYATSRMLAAPGKIDNPGGYVGITRGRTDLRLYSIAPSDTGADSELPSIDDERDAASALSDSLTRTRNRLLATVAAEHSTNNIDIGALTRPVPSLGRRAPSIDDGFDIGL